MLTKQELQEYIQELRRCLDSQDQKQTIQRIYRKGYVAGCNDSKNPVKE